MKQRILCIALGAIISLAVPLQAQTPFFNVYGSPLGEGGEKVIEVPGAGTLVGGRIDDANGNNDVSVTRVDANGNLLWCTKLGTQYEEEFADIAVNPLGGFYVLFTTYDPQWVASLYISTVVVKLDSGGSILWSREFYETGHTRGTAIVATPSGGYTFAASFDSASVNQPYLQITSCDQAGAILWSNLYTTPASDVKPVVMTTAPNGDYIIGVTYSAFPYMQQLVCISSAGVWIWGNNLYLLDDCVVDIAYSGNRIILLTYNNTTHKARLYYAMLYYGFSVWERHIALDTTGNDTMTALDVAGDKIVVSGLYKDTAAVLHNFIMQFDTTGNLISEGEVPYPVSDARYLQNGNVVLTGTLSGAHFATSDTSSIYLSSGSLTLETTCNYSTLTMQADSVVSFGNVYTGTSYSWGNVSNAMISASTGAQVLPGCMTAVEEHAQQQVQIFPNPAGDAVNLVFTNNERRIISVYNTLGETVTEITSADQQLYISAASFAAGMYMVRVSGPSGNSIQTISVAH